MLNHERHYQLHRLGDFLAPVLSFIAARSFVSPVFTAAHAQSGVVLNRKFSLHCTGRGSMTRNNAHLPAYILLHSLSIPYFRLELRAQMLQYCHVWRHTGRIVQLRHQPSRAQILPHTHAEEALNHIQTSSVSSHFLTCSPLLSPFTLYLRAPVSYTHLTLPTTSRV